MCGTPGLPCSLRASKGAPSLPLASQLHLHHALHQLNAAHRGRQPAVSGLQAQ